MRDRTAFRSAGGVVAARLATAVLLALGGLTALSAGTVHAASATVTDCVGTSSTSLSGILAATPAGTLNITFDCHDTVANGPGPYSIALQSQVVVGAGRVLSIDGTDASTIGVNRFDVTLQVPTGLPNGRAFAVSGGGSLSLSNLVLKGAATAPPATSATAPVDQGGVEVTGASTFLGTGVEFLNLQVASELHGGAVYVHPTVSDPGSPTATIGNSSFVGNYANFGGAIDAGPASVGLGTYTSALTLINSSFSGNVAQTAGGAINALAGSKVAVSSDTIAGNKVNATGITIQGSGIYSDTAAANFVIRNTIIANNTGATSAASNNCAYGISSGITPSGANLEYNAGGPTNCGFSVTSDPTPLTFVPTPATQPTATLLVTPYWALGAGSPAVDATVNCTTPLAIDQIGDPRLSGLRCDIGAYELPQVSLVIVCGNLQSANANTPFALPLVVQAVDVNGTAPQNGLTITYTVGPPATNGASGSLSNPPLSNTLTGTTGPVTLPEDCGGITVQGAVSFTLTANDTPSIPGSSYAINVTAADAGGTPIPGVTPLAFSETNLQLVAASCSLRIGFFSSLGSTNGSTSTQFSVATGRLLGGRRPLINYLALRGSAVRLLASPITSSVRCLLPYLYPSSPATPTTRLPLTVDFDATVVSSGVSGIAVPGTIHVTIKQDLGASPPVQTVTITNLAGTTTYYAFGPSNYSVAPQSFRISAFIPT